MTRLGKLLFGIGSSAAGILDLSWSEFEAAHQPVQAWGEHIPCVTTFAIAVAACLILGGIGIAYRRTASRAATILATVYALFGAFFLPRLYTGPHYLGHSPGVYLGVLAAISQQLIMVLASILVLSETENRLGGFGGRVLRWAFGTCSVMFGLAHLTAMRATAPMVPGWLPLSADLWVILTGMAFVFAGLAIIGGVLDVLAAKLLGFMLLCFSVLVLTPRVLAMPHAHVAWGGDAYNVAAIGACWILAGWLSSEAHPDVNPEGPAVHHTRTCRTQPLT